MLRPLLATALVALIAGCAEKKAEEPMAAAAPPIAAPLPPQPARICAKPAEKAAFDMASLKSELMVTALSCSSQERYNAFVLRYRNDLVGAEKNLSNFFSRGYGRSAQQEHDNYITNLANAQSQDGIRAGTAFCQANLVMFDDVMKLRNGGDLPKYATTKTLFQPLAVSECSSANETASAAPVGKKKMN
jgi:hypothetical protein